MVNHPHAKKNVVPETVTGSDGTAKRNILRRGGQGKARKESASGGNVDDGSLYEDGAALDEEDPNYDSEEETGREKIPVTNLRPREYIGDAKITLTQYKKVIVPVINEFLSSGDFEDCACTLEVTSELTAQILHRFTDFCTCCRKSMFQSTLMSLLSV